MHIIRILGILIRKLSGCRGVRLLRDDASCTLYVDSMF